MVSGSRVPQGTRLNPRFTREVTPGLTIAQAIADADNIGGDWTILVYPGTYVEGDLTPNGGADITIRAMGEGRVVIAPVVAPAAGVIVSGFTLHLENIIVTAPDATMPALRVLGGALTAHRSEFNGVGAGDAIQQVGGTIDLYSSYVPVGDIDLDVDDCTFRFHGGEFMGTFDTAGAGIAHTVELIKLRCNNQNFNLAATGACNYYFEGLNEVGDITDASLVGVGAISRCHIAGVLTKNGTSPWDIDHSAIASVNNADAAGAITINGGMLWQCGGATGTVIWYKDNGKLRVLENMGIQTALDAIPAGGGEVEIGEGAFALAAQIARAIDDVTIRGAGLATRITLDGVTAVITAGAQDGWILADFDVDAGLVDIAAATNSTLHNITVNGLHGTVINPDLGQTNFPGQPVVRLEEIRPLDPVATEIIRDFSRKEYQLYNPTFATPNFIMELLNRQARTLIVPTNAGWLETVGVGGAKSMEPVQMDLSVAGGAADTIIAYCLAAFPNIGLVHSHVDWDNELIFAFDIARLTTNATVEGRVQLKAANAIGILAQEGVGLQVINYGVRFEQHNGARTVSGVDVFTLTDADTARILIWHVPGVADYYFINGVLVETLTTNIPAGDGGAACYWCMSLDDGGTGAACNFYVSPILVWNHL